MTKAQKFGVLTRMVLVPLFVFTFAAMAAVGLLWSSVVAGQPTTWAITWGAGVFDALFGLVFAATAVFGFRSWGRGLTITEVVAETENETTVRVKP